MCSMASTRPVTRVVELLAGDALGPGVAAGIDLLAALVMLRDWTLMMASSMARLEGVDGPCRRTLTGEDLMPPAISRRGGGWTPSGCCSHGTCGRPRAACRRR